MSTVQFDHLLKRFGIRPERELLSGEERYPTDTIYALAQKVEVGTVRIPPPTTAERLTEGFRTMLALLVGGGFLILIVSCFIILVRS
ncbi:hypothetical protein ACWDZ6_21730 [Streptomyces sp. NPDC002926]